MGAVVSMRDITAYKRAMTDLQQSEHRFRAIFDGTFQFIGLLDPDGTLIEANRTALAFGGVEPTEVVGSSFLGSLLVELFARHPSGIKRTRSHEQRGGNSCAIQSR